MVQRPFIRPPLFNEQRALDALIKALERWKRLGTRRVVSKGLERVARVGGRRVLPILAVSDPTVARLLIGWAADVGEKELKRRKERPPSNPVTKFSRTFNDTVEHFTEATFGVLAEAVGVVDAMTDAVLPDGLLDDLVDVPEEILRDTFTTLQKITRALRTGEKQR